MQTPEGKVKAKVRAHLKAWGAYRFSPVQMGLGSSTLDELCCINGRFVAIEVKAKGKAPTQRQLLVMEEIRRAGGTAIWGDTAETIIAQLKPYFFSPRR